MKLNEKNYEGALVEKLLYPDAFGIKKYIKFHSKPLLLYKIYCFD